MIMRNKPMLDKPIRAKQIDNSKQVFMHKKTDGVRGVIKLERRQGKRVGGL